MLRWLLLGLLIFGLITGLKKGWVIINWEKFFNDSGFSSVDPDRPFKLSDFIIDEIQSKSYENIKD